SVVEDDTFFAGINPSDFNVHCTRNASRLTPVSDLLAQIRGDRSDDEIVFATITGVPMALPTTTTPAEILAHAGMQYQEVSDPRDGLIARPVCEFIGDNGLSLGKAAPARRLVELASMLPGSVLHTICTDDFGPAIAEIAARIGS